MRTVFAGKILRLHVAKIGAGNVMKKKYMTFFMTFPVNNWKDIRIRMKKYHYLVIFLAGYFMLAPFMLQKLYTGQESVKTFAEPEAGSGGFWQQLVQFSERNFTGNVTDAVLEGTASENAEDFWKEDSGNIQAGGDEAAGPLQTVSGNMPGDPQQAVSGNMPGDPAQAGVSGNMPGGENGLSENGLNESKSTDIMQETESPENYFQDALFIGDSRTMGLGEYADLDNAVVFASTGMNVYRLYTLKNELQNQETLLEDILAEKQYRRIFFMLGINELGYNFDYTVARYEEEILKLQAVQPDAEIILEANLHVTTKRSGEDEIFNNDNINKMNESIRQIAEKHGFTYVDVNTLFDDESGGLNPEYTYDEVHVLGKYYQQWADWLREEGVK